MVYNRERLGIAKPLDMARIQMIESANALARYGHDVDIATAELRLQFGRSPEVLSERVRRVPISRVRWGEYDVVETNFHQGWETLRRYHGTEHPFIIAKLGSVVGAADMPGIYFYGRIREQMFETQREIHAGARYITLLSRPAQDLWAQNHGARDGHLLVPGAAAANIPPLGQDPLPKRGTTRVLFSGNIYGRAQPEANRVLVDKLNALGRRLAPSASLLFAGPGHVDRLDPRFVTNLGAVPYDLSWQHMYHADVGIVVSAGAFMHNNESTKIYHYLRAGLPTVSESGFPNDHVLRESGLGRVVPSDDMDRMAAEVLSAAGADWDRDAGVRYILAHHSWDARMRTYDDVIRRSAAIT